MAGTKIWLRRELEPAIKGALGAIVGWPWSSLIRKNSPVAGQDALPYWQSFRVRTEQGMGCVWAPAPASH